AALASALLPLIGEPAVFTQGDHSRFDVAYDPKDLARTAPSYLDGGIRSELPILPLVRRGAERVLAVGSGASMVNEVGRIPTAIQIGTRYIDVNTGAVTETEIDYAQRLAESVRLRRRARLREAARGRGQELALAPARAVLEDGDDLPRRDQRRRPRGLRLPPERAPEPVPRGGGGGARSLPRHRRAARHPAHREGADRRRAPRRQPLVQREHGPREDHLRRPRPLRRRLRRADLQRHRRSLEARGLPRRLPGRRGAAMRLASALLAAPVAAFSLACSPAAPPVTPLPSVCAVCSGEEPATPALPSGGLLPDRFVEVSPFVITHATLTKTEPHLRSGAGLEVAVPMVRDGQARWLFSQGLVYGAWGDQRHGNVISESGTGLRVSFLPSMLQIVDLYASVDEGFIVGAGGTPPGASPQLGNMLGAGAGLRLFRAFAIELSGHWVHAFGNPFIAVDDGSTTPNVPDIALSFGVDACALGSFCDRAPIPQASDDATCV